MPNSEADPRALAADGDEVLDGVEAPPLSELLLAAADAIEGDDSGDC